MRIVHMSTDEAVEEPVHVRHSGTAGYLDMEVAELRVEMTPRQAAILAAQLCRLVGECADRAQADLTRWVKAG